MAVIVRSYRPDTFRRWYWLLVPLLAILAYAPVLRIGFLADDFLMLNLTQAPGLLLPEPSWIYYRPVETLLIWELGWHLWGFNPAPYHVVGLLTHAAASLVLGLWLAEATQKRTLGLLEGVLFAVFPLHTEAVGWVAAQVSAMAPLFGFLSLFCFTRWWRTANGNLALYIASVLFYGLAIFTKESLFTFIPVMGAAAWLAAPPDSKKRWLRLGYTLLPFVGVLALDIVPRLLVATDLKGYLSTRADYGMFLWDNLATYAKLILAPVNPALFGEDFVSILAVISGLALLIGIVTQLRTVGRLLVVVSIWMIMTVVPVLNIAGVKSEDMEGNRYAYLPAAGYCVGVGALFFSVVSLAPRWRYVSAGVVSVLVLASIGICWVQLRPWQTATVQEEDIVGRLLRLVPPQPRPNGMVWFVENVPEYYKGAPVLRSGLGLSRVLTRPDADYPQIERVADATRSSIRNEVRDAFALRYLYDENRARFLVDYAAGITGAGAPSSPGEDGSGLVVWDFRSCERSVAGQWSAIQAQTSCGPGSGLALSVGGDDPQLESPIVKIMPDGSGAGMVRIRVSAIYPVASRPEAYISQWYWKGQGEDWSEERSFTLPIRQDGQAHVYWTFIPAKETQKGIEGLRFDPVNGKVDATVQWIAVDEVK